MSDNSNIVSAHCVIYFKNFTNSPFNTISKVNSSKLYTAALFVDFAFLYLPFRIVRTFGPYRLHAVHRCGLATVDVACAQSVCRLCVSVWCLQQWAVQKRLNELRSRLGQTRIYRPIHLLYTGSPDPPRERELARCTHPVLSPTVVYDTTQTRSSGWPTPAADECIRYREGLQDVWRRCVLLPNYLG